MGALTGKYLTCLTICTFVFSIIFTIPATFAAIGTGDVPLHEFMNVRDTHPDQNWAEWWSYNKNETAPSIITVVNNTRHGETYVAFLKFDVSELPSASSILSAELGLYVMYLENPTTIWVKYCNDDSWQTNIINWNNKPPVEDYPASHSEKIDTMGQAYQIDVTDHLLSSLKESPDETYLTLVISIRGIGFVTPSFTGWDYGGMVMFFGGGELGYPPYLQIRWEETIPTGILKVILRDSNGNPIQTGVVTNTDQYVNIEPLNGISDSNGILTFDEVIIGDYHFRVSKGGYSTETASVTIVTDETAELIIVLEKEAKSEPSSTQSPTPSTSQDENTNGIPGYPFESILVGFILSVFVLHLLRRAIHSETAHSPYDNTLLTEVQ